MTAGVNIFYVYVEYNWEAVWNYLPHNFGQAIAIFIGIANIGLLFALLRTTVDFAKYPTNCITEQHTQRIS